MKKDLLLPQGKFNIGRDIPGGIYVIAAVNDLSFVTILGPNNKYAHYTLDEEHTFVCHVELENGDTLEISGCVKVRHIPKSISENQVSDFNLIEEIQDFQRTIRPSAYVKKTQATANNNAYKAPKALLNPDCNNRFPAFFLAVQASVSPAK